MIVLKVLGAIDLLAMLAFLMLIFGIQPFFPFLMFCAFLLFLKGMFALRGDVLSFIDLYASLALIISIFFNLPSLFLWVPAFLLLAKGLVSFL
jgi:hypothetical protein